MRNPWKRYCGACLTGIAISCVMAWLNLRIGSGNRVRRAMILGCLLFGVDLILFNFFMPLVFDADIPDLTPPHLNRYSDGDCWVSGIFKQATMPPNYKEGKHGCRKSEVFDLGNGLLKVVASYAVFIAIGLLLSLVPAGELGLSEDSVFQPSDVFYAVRPNLSHLNRQNRFDLSGCRKRDRQRISRRKTTAFCLPSQPCCYLPTYPTRETVSDLTAGYIQGKGLRNLEKSRRYSLKGKQFLNVFLPVGFYLLILELLTLLVCIVSFAPSVSGRKQCIYLFHCPDRSAASSGSPYSFLYLRLSGR